MDNLGTKVSDPIGGVLLARQGLENYYANRKAYLSLGGFVRNKYDVKSFEEIPHSVPDAEDALKRTLSEGQSWFLETMYLNYCLQEKRMQWSFENERDFEWALTKPRWDERGYPLAFKKVFDREYVPSKIPKLIEEDSFLVCSDFLRGVELELSKESKKFSFDF